MASVLLVDDDSELVGLLAAYLQREGFDVDSCSDGAAAVDAALSGRFGIVVLDVMLPKLSGLDALRGIREHSAVPVIMLSARGDDADSVLGLELGADDYVSKPCSPRALTARLRAVLRRGNPGVPEGPLRNGPLRLWPEQRYAEQCGERIHLTSTEFNLLEILLREVGRPVSKAQLSERALGRPLQPWERSVDVHMSSIRHKLGPLPDGRPRIQSVHRQGYQLVRE